MKKNVLELKQKITDLEIRLKECQTALTADHAMKTAIEEMHEGLQIISCDWKYIYINQAAAQHGKKSKEQLLGKTMMECFPGIEKTEMFHQLENTMSDGLPRQMENEFTYPEGNKGWFLVHIESHTEGILIRSLDITERKQLQAQYLHAQKMEAVGLLSSSIAHDFCNKLAIMKIYCDMLLDSVGDDFIAQRLEKIRSAVDKSTALTKQLLILSRKQPFDLRRTDLNGLIEDCLSGIEHLLGENIEIELAMGTELHDIWVDPSQIDQVILNLLINARQAMPDGGKVTITTGNARLTDETGRSRSKLKPGNYVRLTVSDTGEGMSPEVQKHIFEPFFTTKKSGEGTGLGLATTFEIIKQCKGAIEVESQPGQGSTFNFYFPQYNEKYYVESAAETVKVTTLKGKEKVLLVEDDTFLREALSEVLHTSGYSTLTAANVSEADTLFQQNIDQLDLLITDFVIPGRNGRSLVKNFLQQKPGLKVIYISGHSESDIFDHSAAGEQFVFLQKPFSVETLLTTSRLLLDRQI